MAWPFYEKVLGLEKVEDHFFIRGERLEPFRLDRALAAETLKLERTLSGLVTQAWR